MRLLFELLLLASDLSGIPLPEVVPQVQIVTAAQMPCECMAAYEAGVVSVRDDVDLDRPFGRSVLLHELVHHLQVHHHGGPNTPQARFARERDAIDVQNRFLALQGSARRAGFTHRTD